MLAVASVGAARAIVFSDPGFVSEDVVDLGNFAPVGLAFAPDGRMFVWEKQGFVRIVEGAVVSPTPFLDISSAVNSTNDRGLLGFAFDPEHAENGYVYLLYTYDPPGVADPDGGTPRTARLTRWTVDPENPDVALAGSEVVLLGTVGEAPCSEVPAGADCIPTDHLSHTIGTVRFAADGTVFVGAGDGASYFGVDPLALRALDLDSLAGKILRIRPDGTAPGDNPFDDGTSSNRSKVWAAGVRNPYRFAIDPDFGEPVVGDVGWDVWEELDRGRGASFGWPCFEGPDPQPFYQAELAGCAAFAAEAVQPPIYSYTHDEGNAGGAINGGTFYTGTAYPPRYRGNLFFGDLSDRFIRRARFDDRGNLFEVSPFATDVVSLVSIEMGPDGWLYYISYAPGRIRRIVFSGLAVAASATPELGASPLEVAFSATVEARSSRGTSSYSWDFGDGDLSTDSDPIHTYVAVEPTTFLARVTVTDESLASGTDTVTITVGSSPPVPEIASPLAGATIPAGWTLTYGGGATDADEELAESALSWRVLRHRDAEVDAWGVGHGAGGTVRSPSVVDPEATSSLELVLAARDSTGLLAVATRSVAVLPTVFADDFERGDATAWDFSSP